MRKGITKTVKPSRATYEVLEEMVRLKVQEYIQDILEEEVESFLGRKKSERIKGVDGSLGYWNGHGKPKKFSVMNGTITVRRPRVRETGERFESKIIPFSNAGQKK
jgi:transposase-like protein